MKLIYFIIPITIHAADIAQAASSSSSGEEHVITICDHELDPEAISKAIIQHCFHTTDSPSRTIEISLRKKIKELNNSDQDQFKYALIQQFAMNQHKNAHLKVINELLLQSLTDAMAHTEQRINNRWTKRQSAYMAAGTTVIACILTSIVALVINYV